MEQERPGCDAVCIDVETTGLDPAADRVVALGAARVAGGRIRGRWSIRVDPGREAAEAMGEDAMAVHGIGRREARAGRPFAEAWSELEEWLEEGDREASWVAHNAAFDRAFIEAERARHGLGRRGANEPGRWTDSWKLSREEFAGAGHRHGLDALAQRLGVRGRAKGAHHDAGDDAELLARCWVGWSQGQEQDLFQAGGQVEAGAAAPVVRAECGEEAMERWAEAWRRRWSRGGAAAHA